jgi:RHH-type transcriptional regulator, rel operon repressor / antitoxin RelB
MLGPSTHPREPHLLALVERLVEARERGADRGGGRATAARRERKVAMRPTGVSGVSPGQAPSNYLAGEIDGMAALTPDRDSAAVVRIADVGFCAILYTSKHRVEAMRSTTFTVRVDAAARKRLERLAKSTGRSRSFLAAEAINEYLDVNEWQVAGIKRAIASLDRGEGVPHERVKDWVTSWGSNRERPIPKRS